MGGLRKHEGNVCECVSKCVCVVYLMVKKQTQDKTSFHGQGGICRGEKCHGQKACTFLQLTRSAKTFSEKPRLISDIFEGIYERFVYL